MLHYLLENKLNSQFSDSHILNHRIIVASFVEKGSKKKPCILQGFFNLCQLLTCGRNLLFQAEIKTIRPQLGY
jgi:hypothetical protein